MINIINREDLGENVTVKILINLDGGHLNL